MRIRTHMGVSVDGFVAGADGRPALLSMPSFAPGESHGHPEFIEGCRAAVMGRATFDPALGAPAWPWPDLAVYVLTSRPLPNRLPAAVTAAATATELLHQMRDDHIDGDVHLVGGPHTIEAFREVGALDELGLVVLPLVFGDGVPLTSDRTQPLRLELTSERRFSDGAVELSYVPGERIGASISGDQ